MGQVALLEPEILPRDSRWSAVWSFPIDRAPRADRSFPGGRRWGTGIDRVAGLYHVLRRSHPRHDCPTPTCWCRRCRPRPRACSRHKSHRRWSTRWGLPLASPLRYWPRSRQTGHAAQRQHSRGGPRKKAAITHSIQDGSESLGGARARQTPRRRPKIQSQIAPSFRSAFECGDCTFLSCCACPISLPSPSMLREIEMFLRP